jgi:myo-inositol 2-dehydrogenase / D-chiro-inositol 1-dehydrogenase
MGKTSCPRAYRFMSPSASTDRRGFLQAAATSTAGVVAATTLARHATAVDSKAVHQSGSDVIRVGLVGCGGRGSGAAINAMNAGKDIQIVAVGDLFEESVSLARKSLEKQRPEQFLVDDDHAFVGFDCYKQVIDSDIDVVLLASPPHYRPAQIEAAVAAGKHVFAEKPIATDPAGVRRVMAACEQADAKGLNIVSGLCWRYDDAVRQGVAKIHDGAIGEIVSTQANYLTSPIWIRPRKPGETEMQYQCRNWYYFTWLSGDHYVEQFIHSLDKAMWLRHDVPPVKAIGLGGRQLRSDLTQGNIYDHFAVVYEWADGSRTHAYTRQMAGCFTQTEDFISGTRGTAKLLANEIEGQERWKFTGAKPNMYDQEHVELFQAVRGERSRINNGMYMCRSTMMAILGREVCYSGKELTYEQVATSPQDLGPESYNWDQPLTVEVPLPGKYQFPLA